jgi:hypothetical protein
VRQDAVSEVVGALVLIGIAVLGVSVLLVVLFANPLPTRVPSFYGLISNSSRTIYISHGGGDPLYRGQYKILVDNVDETWNFTKSLPDANRTFSHGTVMNATLPRVARRVVMVFNTSWGGGTVLLSADLIKQVVPPPYGWYDSSWYYRKKITIDHTDVPSDQANFPVLISFTEPADLNDALVQADGNDLLFTDSTGMNKLSHELDYFVKNSGILVAWVKVPALSSTTDTVIYLYYGNIDASNQQDPANVWTNSYAGVWHLGEGSGTTRLDSTGNNNDLADTNGVAQSAVLAKIGYGADFVRTSSEYLSITDAAQTGLDITGSITMEAWAKNDETGNAPYFIIDKARGSCGSGDAPYFLRLNNANSGFVRECTVVTGVCGADPTDSQGTLTSITSGNWVFVVGTNDGANTLVYKNGAQTATQAYNSGIFNSDGAFYVGSQVNANYFDGFIDEVRVSNTARSADWITTEYNNQNTPGVGGFLVSIDSEQTKTTMS